MQVEATSALKTFIVISHQRWWHPSPSQRPKCSSGPQWLHEYLFNCARNFIVESHASGASMWKSFGNRIEFVLTHPNGWEGPQQQQIRQAAELAGLVPSGEKGQLQLHLLTEGEASLHFCMMTTLASGMVSELCHVLTCLTDNTVQNVRTTKVLLSLMLEVVLLMLAHIVLCLCHLYLWKRLSQLNVSAYATFIRVQRPNGLLGRLQGSVFVTFRAQRFLQSGY